MPGTRGHASGHQIANDDSPRMPVRDDEVEHLGARMHRHLPALNLPAEGRIGTQEKLLPGLASAVKRARDLHPTEGSVCQLSAILPGEGDAECHALIDDLGTDLRQAVHVRFTRAEVSAFDRVVE